MQEVTPNLDIFHYNSNNQPLIRTVNYFTVLVLFYYATVSAAKVYNVHITIELVLSFQNSAFSSFGLTET